MSLTIDFHVLKAVLLNLAHPHTHTHKYFLRCALKHKALWSLMWLKYSVASYISSHACVVNLSSVKTQPVYVASSPPLVCTETSQRFIVAPLSNTDNVWSHVAVDAHAALCHQSECFTLCIFTDVGYTYSIIWQDVTLQWSNQNNITFCGD